MSPRVLVAVSAILLSGCGNFFEEKARSAVAGKTETTGTVFFADVFARILEPSCIRCHSVYSNYAVVKKDLQVLQKAISQDRMPKNAAPLPDDLKSLLRDWIAAGAPEKPGPGQGPGEGEGLKPNWDSLFVNIFANRCSVCHSPSGEAPWVDLSTRLGMQRTLLKHIRFDDPPASKLVKRLRDPEEPMPPFPPDSNFQQLNEEEIQVVLDWIKAGLP